MLIPTLEVVRMASAVGVRVMYEDGMLVFSGKEGARTGVVYQGKTPCAEKAAVETCLAGVDARVGY